MGRPRSLDEHVVLEKTMDGNYAAGQKDVNALGVAVFGHYPLPCEWVDRIRRGKAIGGEIRHGLRVMLRAGMGTMDFPGMAGAYKEFLMTDQVAAVSTGAESPVSLGAANAAASSSESPSRKDGERRKSSKRRTNQPRDRRPAMTFDDASGQPRQRQRPGDQSRKPDGGSTSARAQARENMIGFMPRVSVPADMCEAVVRSETSHRLFVGHYGRAQVSLYNLFEWLPIRLRQVGFSEDESLEIVGLLEELVNRNLVGLHERLDAELERIKKVATDQAVRKPVNWTKEPISLQLPQLTPQIALLMDALPKFDEICAFYYGLWLAGGSSVKQREKAINHYRNDMAREIRVIMRLYYDSKEYADRRDPSLLTRMLTQPVNDADLPVRLSDEDEVAARELVEQYDQQAAAVAKEN